MSNKFKQTYYTELLFITVNLFFLKLSSHRAYPVITYFIMFAPTMLFLILTLFKHLIRLITQMQIDDLDADCISPKITSLLCKVFMALLSYLGAYYLSI